MIRNSRLHADPTPVDHRDVVRGLTERRRLRAARKRREAAHAVLVWACVLLPVAALVCALAWELGRALGRSAT